MSCGIHINSDIETLTDYTEIIKSYGGNYVQLFVNPQHYDKYNKFIDYLKKYKIKPVVHASYSINLARTWDEYSPWISQFLAEIKLSEHIGAEYIVVHMGKQIDLTNQEAINNMYTSLLYIASKIGKIKILLETSAGQGTEMFYKMDDLGLFYKKIAKTIYNDKFGICLDTCHIYAAGYDISTIKSTNDFLKIFDEYIGLNNIYLLHFNDSKKELGSGVDRHQNIGKGKIGIDGLLYILGYFKHKIPIILETNSEYILDDLKIILEK